MKELISKEKAAEWLPPASILVYLISVVITMGKMILSGIIGIVLLPFYIVGSIIGLFFALAIAYFLKEKSKIAYFLVGMFTIIGLLSSIVSGAILIILLDLFLLYLIYKSRKVYLKKW